MAKNYLFKINTPIGINIRTTENYWALIQTKHPEIKHHLALVKSTLIMPDLITKSKIDNNVLLSYKKTNGYWFCVVAKCSNIDGFIITAYITDKIKEGIKIWPN